MSKKSGKFYKVLRVDGVVFQSAQAELGDGSIGTDECISYTLRDDLLITFHLMQTTVHGYRGKINNKNVADYYALNYEADSTEPSRGQVRCFSIQFKKPNKDNPYLVLADVPVQVDTMPHARLSLEYHTEEPTVFSALM